MDLLYASYSCGGPTSHSRVARMVTTNLQDNAPMSQYIDYASDFVATKIDDSWNWFNNLNREEWMVTLAIGAVAGFVCMLGRSIRK